jgi:translation initiation factor RLI1
MQKNSELIRLRENFIKFTDEAGSYFRQKDDYSSQERIDFILAFYIAFGLLENFFDSDEELRNGKSITIIGKNNIGRVTLTLALIKEEFETSISIIYFNLSLDDIEKMSVFCKENLMFREQAVLKKLFGKFLQA